MDSTIAKPRASYRPHARQDTGVGHALFVMLAIPVLLLLASLLD